MISRGWKCLVGSHVRTAFELAPPALRSVLDPHRSHLHLDLPGSLEVLEDVSDPQDLQLRTSKKATVPGVSKQ